MLQKVAVVAPLSLSKQCVYCDQTTTQAGIVCSSCKKLQPFPPTPPNFFDIFDLAPDLEIDEEALRLSFYNLSQKTHPDTHSQSDHLDQMQASRWSTLINKAFQTLKNTQLRLDYILESGDKKNFSPTAPPTHLAESYFELPDSLPTFLRLLEEEERKLEQEWIQLVSDWKKSNFKDELLPRLKRYTDSQKYLNSLRADLSKTRGTL